ncbi:hypothetical protein [Streptomyces sp. DH37]|uniref:hypothetical protein n=1 Tax=Streptomyces sp. DH37 TaxID=3040122 RepID=UPI0024419762|nr:hypothetical protein [Streptomyces sp. DH37]MDG9703609.1 hypothetical protein [Streptomyces sp. DH37]
MSDYSGPYDGREHDPSEMRSGGERAKETRRPEGEDRAEGERPGDERPGDERPGDEGEGDEGGEQDRGRGTGPAVTGPPPSPES